MTTRPAANTDQTDLLHLRRSFVRHMAADGRSAATRAAYGAAIAQLEAFLADQRFPTTASRLEPEQLEAFFDDNPVI